MKIKGVLSVIISVLLIVLLPISCMAFMDLDADPTPVTSSGSFICKTWGGTTMDSFNVVGGSLHAASFSRSQGLVIYNLSGSCTEGDTVSLDISGSQWDMSTSMVGLDNNQIFMSIQYLNSSNQVIGDAEKYESGKSKSPSLQGSITGSVPTGAVQVVLRGTFTCTWASAYTTASETVGVYVTLAVGEASIPIPSATENIQPTATLKPTASTAPSSGWWPFKKSNSPTLDPKNVQPIVRFGDLYGEVNVLRAEDWAAGNDDAWVFADFDTPLKHGDRIRTLSRSGAILSFSDMSSFEIKPDTVIVLDIANERETKIGLIAGNVWVNLKRMIKDGSMEVEMSQAVAGIKGTILAASVNSDNEEVFLFTSSATVTSKITGETITLKPGQKAIVDKSGEILVKEFDIEAEAENFGIPMKDLKADDYGKNTGWFLWVIIIIVAVVVTAITVNLLKKKKRVQVVTRFCPNCGNPIIDKQSFCKQCGKEISKV